MRLSGRVVLITGAGTGIGRATAIRAAAEGADIAAIGIERTHLESLVDEVRAMGRRAEECEADVSDAVAIEAAVAELARRLGPIDVAHANAGILVPPAPMAEIDLDVWHRVLAVDLTGTMLTFRAALQHFDPEGGVLLATGSSLAIRPSVGLLPYVTAKAGVHAMARALALELTPRKVRVNVIAPGLTDTPMTRGVPGHIERQLAGVPTGQLVDIDDVAALAVHLMTDEARSVTGAVFSVDGGRSVG
jgi:NAD(P)-dependent dehydrogenase (short-subunit alcohol dehydrogenase family)